MAPRTPASTILATALLCSAACESHPPVVVIGVALPAPREIVQVAQAALAALPEGAVQVSVIHDTVENEPASGVDLALAGVLVEIEGLVAVVGHEMSRGSLAAGPVYNEAGVIQVVPTGTSRLLADLGPWTFLLAPNDSIEGEFIASFAVDHLGARTVTIFYRNDEFGVGLRDGVTEAFEAMGTSVLDRVPVRRDSDVELLADQSLLRGTPDVVVLAAGSPEADRAIRRLWERGYRGSFVAGDGVDMASLRQLPESARESVYAAGFWYPGRPAPESQAYLEAHERLTGAPPGWRGAMGYDAVMLLATAAREVGADRSAIRDYLNELGRSRPPYPGVTGPLSFTPDRAYGLIMLQLSTESPVAEWGRER